MYAALIASGRIILNWSGANPLDLGTRIPSIQDGDDIGATATLPRGARATHGRDGEGNAPQEARTQGDYKLGASTKNAP